MENIKPTEIQKELSPETLEKTMGKVFDIDTKGTAYSRIGEIYIDKAPQAEKATNIFSRLKEYAKSEKEKQDEETELNEARKKQKEEIAQKWEKLKEEIQNDLEDGRIGLPSKRSKSFILGGKKETYLGELKEQDFFDPLVYANIVGRAETYADVYGEDKKISPTEIGNSWYMRERDFSVAVLFDKEFFEEVEPKERESGRSIFVDKWTFNSDDRGGKTAIEEIKNKKPDVKIGDEILKNYGSNNSDGKAPAFDENGMPKPYQEWGFVFFPRIPKRAFKGLVVNLPKDEMYGQRIEEVADLVQESNLQIPIYDTDGNVVWPKKMSFEEVKKLTAEKKEETEK
jgi:hypothetical protein